VYIKKEDGRQRPLGVAALEDKLVQYAVTTILNQIYEEDFLGFSYGFRPGRSQHDALDALSYALSKKKVNYILDADVRSFFDNLDKGWMIKFIEHRVADPRILRLIQKWLKAGVMEEGKWSEPKTGTPQGSVISPMLANGYCSYSTYSRREDASCKDQYHPELCFQIMFSSTRRRIIRARCRKKVESAYDATTIQKT
jgi:RNA-directed DNA polymerase